MWILHTLRPSWGMQVQSESTPPPSALRATAPRSSHAAAVQLAGPSNHVCRLSTLRHFRDRYSPAPWLLGNDWFAETIPRKFVQHTGTQERAISLDDEVAMAVQAVKTLQRDTDCDLRNCVALVFVSPSFIPMVAARKYLQREQAREESVQLAAQRVAGQLGMSTCRVIGINWFCAGYVRAMSILGRCLSKLNFAPDKFALVVTASRISRITDYECKQTALYLAISRPQRWCLAATVKAIQYVSTYFPLTRRRMLRTAHFQFSSARECLVADARWRKNAPAATGVFSGRLGHCRRGTAGHVSRAS